MIAGRARVVRLGAAGFVLVLVVAQVASAASLNEIRSRGEQLAQEARGAAGVAAAERSLVERLGALALTYIDESDRLQRGGEEEQRASELRAAFEAIHAPLNGIYRARSGRLEKLSRAVMDEDGDLEALYETAEFQSSQTIAANALYYLNWLDYYGARVFSGDRRAELLRSCESGFSQFAVGDHSAELLSESLLGRGLCYLESGNHEWARRDFQSVIDGKASPERKAKARLALLDSHYRAGNSTRTLSYARELLKGGLVAEDETPVLRYYELRALFDLAERASGAQADQRRREAGAVMSQLRRAGPGWAAKVDALLFSSIKDPAQWAGKADSPAAQWQLAQLLLQKEDCVGAEPLLEKVVASDSGDAKRNRSEALYWLGICHFRAGRHEQAAAALAGALEGEVNAPFAADARYFRFKSLEAMMAVDEPPAGLAATYVESLRELVDKHPDHPRSDEVRYRLGEYLQATGEFVGAVEQYAKVSTDPGYLLRSRFGSLQSRFEILRGQSESAERAQVVAGIGDDLRGYEQQAKAIATAGSKREIPLAEFDAKVALLKAVYVSLAQESGDDEAAAILDGFAARFPEQQALAAQAARMRLGALQRSGRYADAGVEVERSAAALREEGRGDALRTLAASFAKTGRMSEAPADAAAAARVAVALYALAAEAGGEAPSLRQRVSIAQLQEKAGEWDAATATYSEVLEQNSNTLAAWRGLARIAEAQGDRKRAMEHWVAYTDKIRPGDDGWFRGQYEQARLLFDGGDAVETCKRLTALRTAMPGLKDDEIRAALKELFANADC